MVTVSAFAPLASALLRLIIKVVDSGPVKEFFANNMVLIESLKIALLTADTVLSDAEETQITNPNVKEWLNELKHAAYDADDVLDEVTTNALRRQIEARVIAAAGELADRSSNLNPFRDGVIGRLRKIVERLENLVNRRDLLNLKGSARVKPPPRRQTTSLLGESEVFGREKDKEKLIELLLGGTAQENGIPVIAIVGIPGVGKTTLAQLLYNDSEVEKYFIGGKAWVHVSEELDVFKATRTIFESVDSNNCHFTDLNVLQVKLKMALSGKRFLLVLDDMWNENLFDWDLLSAPLKAGECGSRIIVTTRNQGVASIMRAIATHHLTQLSEECCQKLFEKYAFGTSNPDEHPILKRIGDEIASKCKGLPLAAKTLGALLHQESEAKQWHTILNSKIWDLPNDKNNILPALRLSYDHLHPHLKQCFAYCSMLSKGYEFKKDKLILMWMAEGFLQQQPKGEETMEEIGDKYFHELLSRSFFQASTHNKQHFVMHDLVNDLAQFASGEFCFNFEDGKPRVIPEKARHFAWLMNGLDVHEKFEALLDAKSMRTFLLLVSSETEEPPALRTIFKEKKLSKQVRVLSFPVKGIVELPDLGKLIHLRYLDLSNTSITNLTITRSWYNMQTLLLSRCYRLTGLPAEIRKLTNLRHLDVSRCPLITKLPPRFGELTNLQKLTDFWVGEAKDSKSSKISELGRLSCLRGRLSMSRLENVGTDQQASEANLKSKSYLCEIVFSWNTTNTSSDHSLKVLENLEPHTNLEKLTIEKYSGGKFPNWLSKVNFPNMVILHLINCSFCGSLPSLGNLSSLQQLHISKMNNLESVNFGFDSLQKLTIEDCEKLVGELPDDTSLPCLQDLKLLNCPKLSIFSGEGMLIDSFSQIDISKILSEQLCGLPSLEEPQITSLSIRSLLQILGKGLSGLTSLEELQITSLSISLLSDLQILGEGLSGRTSLKNLHIRNCKMPAELPNLQSLVITDCKELEEWGSYRMESPTCSETTNKCDGQKESSKESCLPDTLISPCTNIRFRKQRGSHEMESLIDFEITGKCNEEQSFAEVGLPLRISSLPDLEKLVKGFQHLTSLKRLEIKCSTSIVNSSRGITHLPFFS